jgi:hypothetical protein
MDSKFKKIFSVTLAIILGLGVVFFAWKSILPASNKVSFEPTISGDAWKDSLRAVSLSNPVIRPSTLQREQSKEATTTSDIIARELITNYFLLQQSRATTTLSDTDAQAFAQMLTEKINIPQVSVYTAKNILLSNDNSKVAIATYVKKISEVMQMFTTTRKTNEIDIFIEVLKTKDTEKLKTFTQIIAEYKKLQKNLLAISTPSTLAPLHLRLIQSYSKIESAIVSMQKILNDPMLGLAAFTQYKKEIDVLNDIDAEYTTLQ